MQIQKILRAQTSRGSWSSSIASWTKRRGRSRPGASCSTTATVSTHRRGTQKTVTTRATSTTRWGNTPTLQPRNSGVLRTKCAPPKDLWRRVAKIHTSVTTCHRGSTITIIITITSTKSTTVAAEILVGGTVTMSRNPSSTTVAPRTTRNTTDFQKMTCSYLCRVIYVVKYYDLRVCYTTVTLN
ncbi:hypothetical protein C0J52_22533 [Blattella germanica]|nr:hypothetical protein C0J52_22533 [Blattella germanica]